MMNILSKNKLPVATLLIAIFLRFYKIGPFTVFLSDQGRDAIIVKRIITFEHLPAIGPPTSIGHIFLGPFYYYLIAPFLWISRLNPAGMAIGVALLSIIGLIACYVLIRRDYKKTAADLFLILATFSFINIDYSRFSWNPNPLPYFSFITLYLAVLSFQKKNLIVSFLFGSLFALSIQLHYLAITLL
jgi:4-amino-4-deoxy-L-arabinose transferase-like glycosyltransferase